MFIRWEQRGENFRASLELRIRRDGKVVSVSKRVGSPPVYLTQSRAKEIAQQFTKRYPIRNLDDLLQEIYALKLFSIERQRIAAPHINYIAVLKDLGEPVIEGYFQAGSDLPILINEQDVTLRQCEALWAQVSQIYYRVLARFFVSVFLGCAKSELKEITSAAYIFPATVFSELKAHLDWFHQYANNTALPHGLSFVQALFIAGLKEFYQSLEAYANMEDFINVLAADIVEMDRLGETTMDVNQQNISLFAALRSFANQNFKQDTNQKVEYILHTLMGPYGPAVGERDYTSQAVMAWKTWQKETDNCKGWC